jgi:Flp pilus assembly protein TadD
LIRQGHAEDDPMGPAMTNFSSSLAALLLCGTALAGCASDNAGSALGNLGHHKNVASDSAPVPTDVESGVRQAQLAREAGRYDDAIHTLSQMMLVASDDPRVVSEYGKALAERGRAAEAVQFLTRATELQPRDWTLYSAMGVAYDEEGDQNSARQSYDHALALKPGDPSILNNYALSRMMANDPAMARQLIASAASAGGASDPKIARNIELVNSLAAIPQPSPIAALPKPASAPVAAVKKPSAAQVATREPLPAVTTAPKALQPAVPPLPATAAPQVVMQPVSADPAKPAKVQAKPAKPDDKSVQAADAKPVKDTIPDLRQTALTY